MLRGELHMVPFEEPPQRILDVGTGTGIWAIDIAELVPHDHCIHVHAERVYRIRADRVCVFSHYPSAEVIGTDLSAIQPRW